MQSLVFLSLALSFTWIQYVTLTRSNSCPCNNPHFCNCSAKNLQYVPRVPVNVLELDLSFNDIESVDDKDLRDYTKLKVLILYKNKLKGIHAKAFSSQTLLRTLDLSFNQLPALDSSWFENLIDLQHLNLSGNTYNRLGPDPLFQTLKNLKTLRLGNPFLKEVIKHGLNGPNHLDVMEFHGSNLKSYEGGSFRTAKPITLVTLSLYNPFLEDPALVSKILRDVSNPNTSLVISDVIIESNNSVEPFKECNWGGTTKISFLNVTTSDEGIISLIKSMNGSSLSYLSVEDMLLNGGGWWESAHTVQLRHLHTVYLRNVKIEDFSSFSSMLQLRFLLKYLLKVSVVNCTLFVMPCPTSFSLTNLKYLDLSQNLLSDLTIKQTLCDGLGILWNLNVLTVSQNSLKSLGLMSLLVVKLNKLTALDLSYNTFITMPESCVWPVGLTSLNLSATRLRTVTPCLPESLKFLDLSDNDLTVFSLTLPNLIELLISGNKFINLPAGILFPSLEMLSIQNNSINLISEHELKGYENLKNLEAGHNNFVCTCEFVAFFQHRIEQLVALRDGPLSYVCDSPFQLRGQTIKSAKLTIFECHMITAVSILCSGILLAGLFLGFTCHRLHVLWYLKMTWAWLQAKRRPTVVRSSTVRYDAFVSYSEFDAEWVEDFLVPELENNEPPFSLCLHKRDFQPGRWIVDNIIDSIEKSAFTLYILSEHFVTSEWCRYELDFSHFRLVDEQNDTAVLILLEPIAKDTIPKRFCKLQKVMNSKTYLEWPVDEEERAEFWQKLKDALRRDLSDNQICQD